MFAMKAWSTLLTNNGNNYNNNSNDGLSSPDEVPNGDEDKIVDELEDEGNNNSSSSSSKMIIVVEKDIVNTVEASTVAGVGADIDTDTDTDTETMKVSASAAATSVVKVLNCNDKDDGDDDDDDDDSTAAASESSSSTHTTHNTSSGSSNNDDSMLTSSSSSSSDGLSISSSQEKEDTALLVLMDVNAAVTANDANANDDDEIYKDEDDEEATARRQETEDFSRLEAEEEEFMMMAVGDLRSIALENAKLIADAAEVENSTEGEDDDADDAAAAAATKMEEVQEEEQETAALSSSLLAKTEEVSELKAEEEDAKLLETEEQEQAALFGVNGIAEKAEAEAAEAKLTAEAEAKERAKEEAVAAATKANAEVEANKKVAKEEAHAATAATAKAEAEAQKKAEEEASAAADAKTKAAQDAKLKADEDARQNAEAKAEAALAKAAQDAKLKADEDPRQNAKAETEAALAKVAQDAKLKADEDARQNAEIEAESALAKAAQDAKLKADEDARQNAETEAEAALTKAAQDAKLKADEDARQNAEAEYALMKAKEEASLKAAAEASLKVEEVEAAARVKTEADAARVKVEQYDPMMAKVEEEEVRLTSEDETANGIEVEEVTLIEADEEVIPNTIDTKFVSLKSDKNATATVPTTAKASVDVDVEDNKEAEDEVAVVIAATGSKTTSLSLAQQMKQMFDSASPDEPSNAFGNNAIQPSVSPSILFEKIGDDKEKEDTASTMATVVDVPCDNVKVQGSPIASSLAKDMKKMFDSPSPDEASMAFGIGKGNTKQSQQPVITSPELLLHRATVTEQVEDPKAGEVKWTSPTKITKKKAGISVAEQMVSLLWASSEPKKKKHITCIDQVPHRTVDDNPIRGDEHTVTLETVVDEDEVMEEITVDENDDVTVARDDDDDDDDFIEEVVIEDDYKDGMSVTTAGEFFESTACIEISPDFVTTIEKEDDDGRSYDEITADDWEYDENTVDGDGDLLNKDQNENVASKEPVEEKEVEAKATTATNNKKILYSAHVEHSLLEICNAAPVSSYATNGNTKENAAGAAEEIVVSQQKDSKSFEAITHILPTAPAQETDTTSISIKTNSPKADSGKRNSTTGKLAERLKMFDSPKATSDHVRKKQPIAFKQSWRKPKPLIESKHDESDEKTKEGKECDQKTPTMAAVIEPRVKNAEQLDLEKANTSGDIEKDKALAEEIMSLLNEPGAMQNKPVLAERIVSLLVGMGKGAKLLATECTSYAAASSKLVESPSSKSKLTVETNAYSNRKKDGFKDPGLKQVRNDIVLQKGKLYQVGDPDTISKRKMKRINIKQLKEEQSKQTSVKPVADTEKDATDISSPVTEGKHDLAEQMMARIWPKTQAGTTREPRSLSSISLKSAASKIQNTPSTRKLGDRLKMFESTSSSSLSPRQKPRSGNDTTEKDHAARVVSFKINSDSKVSKLSDIIGASTENTDDAKIAAPIRNSFGETSSNKISNKTLKTLCSFQRLWRKMKSKHDTTTLRKDTVTKDAASLEKIVAAASKMKVCPGTSASNNRNDDVVINKPVPITLPEPASAPTSTSSEMQPTVSSGCDGYYYILDDFEQRRFDQNVVDMEKWEGFLSDDEFLKHFGLSKDDFYKQPKWKCDKQKRKVRVAF